MPLLVYAIFGTSKQLSVGPDALASILVSLFLSLSLCSTHAHVPTRTHIHRERESLCVCVCVTDKVLYVYFFVCDCVELFRWERN